MYTCHIFFIHTHFNGHWSIFHKHHCCVLLLLAWKYNSILDKSISNLLGKYEKNGISESYGSSTFGHFGNHNAHFNNWWTNSHCINNLQSFNGLHNVSNYLNAARSTPCHCLIELDQEFEIITLLLCKLFSCDTLSFTYYMDNDGLKSEPLWLPLWNFFNMSYKGKWHSNQTFTWNSSHSLLSAH